MSYLSLNHVWKEYGDQVILEPWRNLNIDVDQPGTNLNMDVDQPGTNLNMDVDQPQNDKGVGFI